MQGDNARLQSLFYPPVQPTSLQFGASPAQCSACGAVHVPCDSACPACAQQHHQVRSSSSEQHPMKTPTWAAWLDTKMGMLRARRVYLGAARELAMAQRPSNVRTSSGRSRASLGDKATRCAPPPSYCVATPPIGRFITSVPRSSSLRACTRPHLQPSHGRHGQVVSSP